MRVLAVIADWERKRGDDVVLAVEQARQSREIGLTIVGRTPEGLPPWVDTPGVVDRSVLAELYREHDVLLDLALANAAGVGEKPQGALKRPARRSSATKGCGAIATPKPATAASSK